MRQESVLLQYCYCAGIAVMSSSQAPTHNVLKLHYQCASYVETSSAIFRFGKWSFGPVIVGLLPGYRQLAVK